MSVTQKKAGAPGGDPVCDSVEASLRHYVKAGHRLTVGYSGGLDSTVLLHVLAGLRAALGFSLSALHVHHGLSPHADAWALHCAAVCRSLAVPLQIEYVEVQRKGEGLEAAARAARYRVYTQLATDFLLLAQHRDDQAETVLLQLLRGASLKGLAAMPAARALVGSNVGSIILLRPLLTVTRAEMASWAQQHALRWVEDESNTDIALARNALRHGVLPSLSARFPHAVSVLAKSAAQFAEAASLLDALAAQDAQGALSAAGLSVSVLSALPEARARNVLRYFLAQAGGEIHGVEIQYATLCEALRQVLFARHDAQVRVDFGAVSLRRYRQIIRLVPIQSAEKITNKAAVKVSEKANDSSRLVWRGESSVALKTGGVLRFQPVIGAGVRLSDGQISIRQRVGGERIQLLPERPRRTLKNLLQEAGIAPWQRALLPLVYVNECLVWVAAIGADCAFLAQPGEPGWLIDWQEN